ncbi:MULTISPECIES: peptidase domain-containing ABC transporter [Nostoc]|uniref:Peptidase domain-containing ABC transporter n=1 Tax=Nostoc paludosum FACHB-159 TaxID=2692908 RepID=A0ABR8K3L6_9NOSO|nr:MULTISPECIES: peptidase domain-containing ABC transporter [Nostoc]MBD2677223.1 peptidase domain-containing ABC transporter [Nostoc sp. FACHB-857]MBD2732968.1 peptidase domain-containing ABC transporter [Nostoc paludosum FACHB-159]
MKYQIVLQHSEEDCGAACIASIAKYYGRNLAIARVREAVGTGAQGTTLVGLKRGAQSLGFNARPVRATPQLIEKLHEAPLPAIIHWKGYHWVVLYGKKGKKYVIADPSSGIRYLTPEELTIGWANYVMLLLLPDEIRFYQQQSDKITGFGRFLARVLPYRHILIEAILINLAMGIFSLASPFLIQILTDDVLVRGDTQLLTTVAIGVIAINLFNSTLTLVQSNLIAHFAQRLELGLTLEFGRQILRLPLTYYEARRSGEIVSRLRDIQEINQMVSQVVIALPSRLFVAAISLAFMIFYSPKLLGLSVLVALLMSLSTIIFLPSLRQKIRNLMVTQAENQGMLVEIFKGILTVKTANAAPQAWEEIQSRFGNLAYLTFSTVQIGIINNVFSGLVSGFGNLAILWFGSSLVINQELSIGQLLAFNAMNANFNIFITTIIGFVDEFARVQTATQRITEVIESTPEDENEEKKPWAVISGNADIICNKLDFHHTGRADLLQDFSLTIPGGKVTALIGKSGCGKSTLAKLIAGLYTLRSGNIRFGIYNQKDLSLECRRQQVVLVPQEPHFWSRSILENFRFSYPQATFEQIVRACQIAGVDEFICDLPDNYQTVLGEFGVNISGGQKQRLALARAIVTEPPILILDESTSALDPILESQVLDKLLHHRQGKTTIIISHRPRVILRADFIVLLDKGQLKMQGVLKEMQLISGEHLDFLTP